MTDREENRKLLIVDDDTGIQRQLRWSFEGYEVEVAGDREEAIARFRAEVPPVVTVDLGCRPTRTTPTKALPSSTRFCGLRPRPRSSW